MALAAIPTDRFLDAIADALETLFATTAELGLFKNSPTLTDLTVLADLTEPTFTGYARAGLTPATRRSNANHDIIIPMGTVTFQPSATPSPAETCNGCFMVADTPTAHLYLAEYFDNPFTFAATTDALDITYELIVLAGGGYGGVCTTCPTL